MVDEGTKISYENFQGIVSFSCDNYVVIDIAKSSNRNPARLLIYRYNYKKIQVLQ